MNQSEILQIAVNGLSQGAVYALVAVGITLVFGLTRIVNFAHGAMMAVGAYVVYEVARGGGARFWFGLVCAIVIVGVLSLVLERTMFRFTISNPINGFIVSLGLILVLENALALMFSENTLSVIPATYKVYSLGGARIPVQSILIVAVTIVVFVALYLVVNRTRLGIALRAASADREMLSMLGMPVERLIAIVFVVGGMLAGVAGGLVATTGPIVPELGDSYIIFGFVVALLGGLGNVKGSLVGGVLMGVVASALGTLGYGEWVDMAAFVVIIMVMLLRPQGLFGGADGRIR